MGAKFTKGKWYANPEKFDDCHITSELRSGMQCICKINSAYFDDLDKNDFEVEQLANAHLIAAAPEMYEALEMIKNEWNLECSDMDFIEILLAKARGEQ